MKHSFLSLTKPRCVACGSFGPFTGYVKVTFPGLEYIRDNYTCMKCGSNNIIRIYKKININTNVQVL